jgi:hypothetical protein
MRGEIPATNAKIAPTRAIKSLVFSKPGSAFLFKTGATLTNDKIIPLVKSSVGLDIIHTTRQPRPRLKMTNKKESRPSRLSFTSDPISRGKTRYIATSRFGDLGQTMIKLMLWLNVLRGIS